MISPPAHVGLAFRLLLADALLSGSGTGTELTAAQIFNANLLIRAWPFSPPNQASTEAAGHAEEVGD